MPRPIRPATSLKKIVVVGNRNGGHEKNSAPEGWEPGAEDVAGEPLHWLWALRSVPPGRAGFPLAVRLTKWRTLAGEWCVGDLKPIRVMVEAMPGESPAPATHPTAAQADSEPRRYTRPALCLEKLSLRKGA